jgi:hypothetical protein
VSLASNATAGVSTVHDYCRRTSHLTNILSAQQGVARHPPFGGVARHPPFGGLPDTHRLAGLPDTHRLAGLPDTHRLAGLPDTQGCQTPTVWRVARLPDTRRGLRDTHRWRVAGVGCRTPTVWRVAKGCQTPPDNRRLAGGGTLIAANDAEFGCLGIPAEFGCLRILIRKRL